MSLIVDSPTVASLPATADRRPVVTAVQRLLVRDLWLVGHATLVGQIVAIATSVVLRWLLDPASLGIWQSLRLFLSYGNYLNLGASKGAARELSVAMGRGTQHEMAHEINLAHTVNTLSSAAYAVVLFAASFRFFASAAPLDRMWGIGLAFLALFVVVQRHVTFHITLLRAEQRFDLAARQSIYEGVALLACGACGAWLAGLPGLFIATFIVALGSLGYLRRHATFALQWSWNSQGVRRLLAIGSPILLTGMLTTLFRSLDRLVLLAYSPQGAFDLGCYSTGLLVGAQLYGLASICSTVTSPKLAQLYGATQDKTVVARFAAEALETQLRWLAPLGAGAIVVGPWLLGILFPAYRAGLIALPAIVVGSVAAMIALYGSNTLTAISQERIALRGLGIATLVAGIGLCGVGLVLPTLSALALASCLANVGYAMLSGYDGLWQHLPTQDRQRWLLRNCVTLAPTLGTAILCEQCWPVAETLTWSSCSTVLSKLAWVGAVAIVATIVVRGLNSSANESSLSVTESLP